MSHPAFEGGPFTWCSLDRRAEEGGLCFRAMGGDLVLVKKYRIFRILHCVRSEVLTEPKREFYFDIALHLLWVDDVDDAPGKFYQAIMLNQDSDCSM